MLVILVDYVSCFTEAAKLCDVSPEINYCRECRKSNYFPFELSKTDISSILTLQFYLRILTLILILVKYERLII